MGCSWALCSPKTEPLKAQRSVGLKAENDAGRHQEELEHVGGRQLCLRSMHVHERQQSERLRRHCVNETTSGFRPVGSRKIFARHCKINLPPRR
jgi:hypothetical protein